MSPRLRAARAEATRDRCPRGSRARARHRPARRCGGEVVAVGDHGVGVLEHVARARARIGSAATLDEQVGSPRGHDQRVHAGERADQPVVGHEVRVDHVGPKPSSARKRGSVASG